MPKKGFLDRLGIVDRNGFTRSGGFEQRDFNDVSGNTTANDSSARDDMISESRTRNLRTNGKSVLNATRGDSLHNSISLIKGRKDPTLQTVKDEKDVRLQRLSGLKNSSKHDGHSKNENLIAALKRLGHSLKNYDRVFGYLGLLLLFVCPLVVPVFLFIDYRLHYQLRRMQDTKLEDTDYKQRLLLQAYEITKTSRDLILVMKIALFSLLLVFVWQVIGIVIVANTLYSEIIVSDRAFTTGIMSRIEADFKIEGTSSNSGRRNLVESSPMLAFSSVKSNSQVEHHADTFTFRRIHETKSRLSSKSKERSSSGSNSRERRLLDDSTGSEEATCSQLPASGFTEFHTALQNQKFCNRSFWAIKGDNEELNEWEKTLAKLDSYNLFAFASRSCTNQKSTALPQCVSSCCHAGSYLNSYIVDTYPFMMFAVESYWRTPIFDPGTSKQNSKNSHVWKSLQTSHKNHNYRLTFYHSFRSGLAEKNKRTKRKSALYARGSNPEYIYKNGPIAGNLESESSTIGLRLVLPLHQSEDPEELFGDALPQIRNVFKKESDSNELLDGIEPNFSSGVPCGRDSLSINLNPYYSKLEREEQENELRKWKGKYRFNIGYDEKTGRVCGVPKSKDADEDFDDTSKKKDDVQPQERPNCDNPLAFFFCPKETPDFLFLGVKSTRDFMGVGFETKILFKENSNDLPSVIENHQLIDSELNSQHPNSRRHDSNDSQGNSQGTDSESPKLENKCDLRKESHNGTVKKEIQWHMESRKVCVSKKGEDTPLQQAGTQQRATTDEHNKELSESNMPSSPAVLSIAQDENPNTQSTIEEDLCIGAGSDTVWFTNSQTPSGNTISTKVAGRQAIIYLCNQEKPHATESVVIEEGRMKTYDAISGFTGGYVLAVVKPDPYDYRSGILGFVQESPETLWSINGGFYTDSNKNLKTNLNVDGQSKIEVSKIHRFTVSPVDFTPSRADSWVNGWMLFFLLVIIATIPADMYGLVISKEVFHILWNIQRKTPRKRVVRSFVESPRKGLTTTEQRLSAEEFLCEVSIWAEVCATHGRDPFLESLEHPEEMDRFFINGLNDVQISETKGAKNLLPYTILSTPRILEGSHGAIEDNTTADAGAIVENGISNSKNPGSSKISEFPSVGDLSPTLAKAISSRLEDASVCDNKKACGSTKSIGSWSFGGSSSIISVLGKRNSTSWRYEIHSNHNTKYTSYKNTVAPSPSYSRNDEREIEQKKHLRKLSSAGLCSSAIVAGALASVEQLEAGKQGRRNPSSSSSSS